MPGRRGPPEGEEQRGAGGGGASRGEKTVWGEDVEPLATWGVLWSRGN